MSFQNSLVFPFPAVQYIPLPITNLRQGQLTRERANHSTPQTVAPKLIAGNDLITWESSLEREYGLSFSGEIDPGNLDSGGIYADGICPFLAIHLKVTIVKYRSFFITMLGEYTPDQYQMFTIPTQRLYKSNLMIELFDQNTGKRLVHQNLFWKPGSASSGKPKNPGSLK